MGAILSSQQNPPAHWKWRVRESDATGLVGATGDNGGVPGANRRRTGGGPEADRWWTGGGPVVDRRRTGGGPGVDRRWTGGGPVVDRWWTGGDRGEDANPSFFALLLSNYCPPPQIKTRTIGVKEDQPALSLYYNCVIVCKMAILIASLPLYQGIVKQTTAHNNLLFNKK